MKRVVLICGGLLAVAIAGGYMYLQSHVEMITGAVGKAVESATGKPLILDEPPGLSIFPKLGLDVGKARWGDAQKDDLAVTCDQAVVRIDLMALLSGRIEVNEVVLDAPRLVYRQAPPAPAQPKAGQEGAPAARPATPSAPAAGEVVSGEPNPVKWADLRLDAVRINGGDVHVDQPGLNLQLSKLDLVLTDFAAGKAGKLQVAAHVALRGNEPIEAGAALKLDFVPQYPMVKVQHCAFTLTPLKGLPITKPVSVSGGMDIDTALLSLTQMDLAVDFAGSIAQLKGQLSPTGPSGQFEAALRGIPRETLAACGVTLQTQDPKALGALELSSRVKLSGVKVELADLKGKLDDTIVSGDVSASAASIAGTLKLGALNVDRYVPAPQASGSAAAGKPAPPAAGAEKNAAPAKPQPANAAASPSAYPEVRLELAVESLRVNNVLIAGIKALIQGKAGQYTLDPCTFRFYESAASLTARARLTDQQYSLKTSANNINAGALFKDAAKVDTVQGKVNVQADLSVRGQDEAAIRRSLGGATRLTGQLDVDTGLLPSGWGQLIRDIKTINVNKIDVAAKADKGRIVLKPITADGQIKVNGQGTVDLPSDALDIRLDASLAGLPLPLLVGGTLKNPAYSIDPVGALKNVLENQKAGKAVEEGLKGLMKMF
ncbi:MAG: AsmA family protein [Deltaproteobacteria bacterium]|nr:AsmA family protein [Deltaproteobacteria bacterium]